MSARARANLAALRTLRTLQAEDRPATDAEREILGGWWGWGAVPQIFDPGREALEAERAELRELLSESEWRAASRSTLNAHYTDPRVREPMWRLAAELGFAGGEVLEPGCGAGGFFDSGPDGPRYVGVELDPITADIARRRHPEAEIHTESFAETRLPDGHFDLVIGNVPFGNYVLHDPTHNPGRHSIHNHFLLKSLHLTKPGGLMLAITSRYTLDSTRDAHRRELAELGDLIGAIRLPNTAHRAAGTQAVTDIVVFRRRKPGEAPRTSQEWLEATTFDGTNVPINRYFINHSRQICGVPMLTHGLYRDDELTVNPPLGGHFHGALEAACRAVAEHARATNTLADTGPVEQQKQALGERSPHPEGLITFGMAGQDSTRFLRTENGRLCPFPVPASQHRELGQLLQLRDAVRLLLQAEADPNADERLIADRRAMLNTTYDRYVERFGPLNRFSWRRTGRTDPETGQDKLARIRPPQGQFRTDPYAPLVYALEVFNDTTQTAAKADIFRQRVVAPPREHTRADSPADALAISLDTHGEVRLDTIARLLDLPSEADAEARLADLVFADPDQDGRLEPARAYLSGNVRAKLRAAEQAAEADPERYGRNVSALREVLPADLTAEQIRPQMGAVWIEDRYVQQFLQELLDDDTVRVEHAGSTWIVEGRKYTTLATSQWGTEARPAPEIAEAVLEQRPIIVRETVPGPDGTERQVVNYGATVAAQEKADEMREAFADWLWSDPDRTRTLVTEYNERFNSIVLRNYDDVELSLPGLAVGFEPRPHQVAAVARMINEPAVGLFHEVGAGKTAEMVMGIMEQRRLGLVSKPVVVVPNNMLEQFAREWQQLYPQARVLMATKDDLTRDRRRQFVARVATGDWDGVVMTRSAFERIPMSLEVQRDYLERETEALRAQLERLQDPGSRLVKRIEKAIARAEERIQRQMDSAKDPGITFEDLGVDYVVVDEAHGYKNLRTASNIPGAAIEGSQRATDLDMKLDYLRGRNPGGRVGTFATATPIANSITEAYVMQRYLRPDLLAEAGIRDFDEWAATFGKTVTSIELSPDGGSFRTKSRFAKFQNVPELLQMWFVSADIKTAADLQLPTPRLADPDGRDGPETIMVEPSPELEQFIGELAARAEEVRSGGVDPTQDNMLTITGDGRAAALDLRLREMSASTATKLDVAADTIAAIHHQHADDVFVLPDGAEHPTRGSLQIVFCDLGTPHPERWNAYHQLADDLAARGVPRDKIAFIHDATTDQAKGRLFAACRNGDIAVLIGSTERMGVGTNVQTRAAALHHLDCPWRPADLQQREGRILRQGNQHESVRILRYITEKSFDAYSWQTVSRKAEFIAQMMRGRLDVRELDDIGDAALNYNEVKALATGRPEVIEHAEAKAELTRLERLQRSHDQTQHRLHSQITQNRRRIDTLTGWIDTTRQAAAQVQPTRGDAFALTLRDGTRHTDRPDAGQALIARITSLTARTHRDEVHEAHAFTLGGLPHHLRTVPKLGTLQVRIQVGDTPAETVLEQHLSEFRNLNATGLVSRLENRLAQLPGTIHKLEAELADTQRQLAQAEQMLGAPFPHAQALRDAQLTVAHLEEILAADEHTDTDTDTGAEPATPAADAPAPDRAPGHEPEPPHRDAATPASGPPEPPRAEHNAEPHRATTPARLTRLSSPVPVSQALTQPLTSHNDRADVRNAEADDRERGC